VNAAEVSFASPSGALTYADSADHFENALLRLLNLDRADFEHWLALADERPGTVLERLRDGFAALRPLPEPAVEVARSAVGPGPDGVAGRVWHPAIAESPEYGTALSEDGSLGWLVRHDGRAFVRVTDPPVYEEDYFEGDKLSAGGYGDYAEQAGWRLEKSARQVREMLAATGLEHGRVLDIGSGYGYFRQALALAGFEHDGLEISAHARAVARESYGFDTFGGTLDDHWRGWADRYDGVVLFDLIEHVEDAESFVRQVTSCLRPGGVVGIKTPNADCPEAEVFGPHYHSLKREHLYFFTPDSLGAVAARAGLEPAEVATTSHLLVGFVGPSVVQGWEREGRGADIVAWFHRPD
jgi:SAM-dependent methyltransferase